LIWKIEESYEELSKGIKLTNHSASRVEKMKSEIHRKGFLSVRHLLKAFGYTDYDMHYDEYGKPHLKNGKQISITHSFNFAGVIIGVQNVGIDIEKQRDKIKRIAHKFVRLEADFVNKHNELIVRVLTVIWGAKESLYKLFGKTGLSFEENMQIAPFDLNDQCTKGTVIYNNKKRYFDINYMEFEGFTCVYALPLETNKTKYVNNNKV